ncbi:MAG: GNAT family N-acetyltransferase [Actinomycetota bacterium]|nr:GNAT family N-acetyltransferase [Actinomycetota bacterium]
MIRKTYQMNKGENQKNSFPCIKLSNLKPGDLNDYLRIEFDAFYDKLKYIYSNRKKAAMDIVRSEILKNIDTGRYFNAIIDDKIAGIIEIVTIENIKSHTKNFRDYLENLGLQRAIRAFVLTSKEIPRLDNKTIYIDNVAVDAESRRQGVAKKMLSFVEDYARENGKSVLKLWVAHLNKNAYDLYKKFGFVEQVKRSSWITGKYTGYRDWIFMKKEIS